GGFNVTARLAPYRYAGGANGCLGGGGFSAAHRGRTLRAKPGGSLETFTRGSDDPPSYGKGGSRPQPRQRATAPGFFPPAAAASAVPARGTGGELGGHHTSGRVTLEWRRCDRGL